MPGLFGIGINFGSIVNITATTTTRAGGLGPLVIGDDYLAPDRAFKFKTTIPTHFDVEDATCFFGGQHCDEDISWLVEGEVSEATVDGELVWLLTFEMERDETSLLTPGRYEWSVKLQGPAPEHQTRSYGLADWVELYT